MNNLIDTHTHTTASGHAYSSIEENSRSAFERGVKLIAITDHGPALPGGTSEIHFHNFKVIPRVLNGVEIMMGVELNIMDYDGTVDLPDKILAKMDIAIASLHSLCIPTTGTIEQNTQAYINTMKNKYVHIIGHPGDPNYPTDLEMVVKASKKTGTLLEINNSSLVVGSGRDGSRGPMMELLKLCKKEDVSIILGSDAHFSSQIGEFELADELLKEVDFPTELVINADLKKFKDYIKFLRSNNK